MAFVRRVLKHVAASLQVVSKDSSNSISSGTSKHTAFVLCEGSASRGPLSSGNSGSTGVC
jgi:hypothetical protein